MNPNLDPATQQNLNMMLMTAAADSSLSAEMIQTGLQALIQGADPNYKNADKVSVLTFALARKNVPLSEALIKAGADVNYTHSDSTDSLYYARNGGAPMAHLVEMILDVQNQNNKPVWSVFDTESVVLTSKSLTNDVQIMDIFNFVTHERTRIAENTRLKTMAMTAPQTFYEIDAALIAEAFEFYKEKGGKIDRATATAQFSSRPSIKRKAVGGPK